MQSLHLKTVDSVALPIWTCGLGLEEGSRWHGLVEGEESDEDEDEDEDEEDEMDVDEVVVEMGKIAKAKGTKRPAEENTREQENPRKKAKGAQPT